MQRRESMFAAQLSAEEDAQAKEQAFEEQKRSLQRRLENMKLLQSHSTLDDAKTFQRDRLFAANAVISIVSVCLLFELNWEPTPDWKPPTGAELEAITRGESFGLVVEGEYPRPGRMIETTGAQVCKSVILVTTILLIIQVFEYHHNSFRMKNRLEAGLARKTRFLDSSQFKAACVEVFAWLWQGIPVLPPEFDHMYLTVWFRVLLLVKLVRGFSDVYRKRQQIVEACISHGQPVPIFDWEFILKSIFIKKPVIILLFLSAINIFTFGHMMYVGEVTACALIACAESVPRPSPPAT